MRSSKTRSTLLWLGVALTTVWSLGPFLWQFITSIKGPEELLRVPPTYLPHAPTLVAYKQVFVARPFATYILNSFLVALGTTALCTAFGTLAAYAFSRPGLRGARAAMTAILVMSVFPCTLVIIALKRMMVQAGLLNSLWSLILSYTALNLPFAIWVLQTFFKQVPADIEEAAQVDGLSRWATLWKIIFPLSIPAVATTAILVFIFSWNEFLLALAFISRDSARTVPVGIALLSGVTVYEVPWDQISAAVVVTTLPVVAMVLAFQRRILQGLTAGAVKG
jgi:multiple sugar transport system permease protein